jgi:hypothetical protein
VALRVFPSSPGDVADERGLARKVLARLPQEAQFRGRVLIEDVSWDKPAAPLPLAARLTPQEAINQGLPRPAECDVVLVILWARMGTPLPPEYVKPDGGRFESGTAVDEIHAELVRRRLHEFGAKVPVRGGRATLRRQLWTDRRHRVVDVSRGVFPVI